MSPLRAKTTPPRGIVRGPGRGRSPGPLEHHRFEPPEALQPYVEHLWVVRWRLPAGETFEATTLPHPSAHWTVQEGQSTVIGVHRGRFVQRLSGEGRVVAVKFRPGGLCAFTPLSMHTLTDRRTAAAPLLGAEAAQVAAGLDALDPEQAAARLARVLQRLPVRADPAAAEARALVERIVADPELSRVETLARLAGKGVLALQRLFRAKVGASPKWVLQRYRLHEALERLAVAGAPVPKVADLAAELGFADQAHFTRTFKLLAGLAPALYLRELRARAPR